MSNCKTSNVHQIIETKTWEQDSNWPDTSKPPDTQSKDAEWLPGQYNGCDEETPPGTIRVLLENVLTQQTTCSVNFNKWYQVDPEIPHIKTYHIVETKVTRTEHFSNQTYVYINVKELEQGLGLFELFELDPSVLEALKHAPL